MRLRGQSQVGTRPVESVVQIPEQIIRADLVQHVGARERKHRLGVYIGQEEKRPVMLATAGELLQRVQTGRVDRGDVTHSNDQDSGLLRYLTQRILELLRCTKEERAVDLEHLDARRDKAPPHRIRVFFLVGVLSVS